MSDMSKGLSLTLNTDEWVKQLDDNQREGRELERAAIVAWLRSVGGTLNVWADQIERGEHLRGDDA